MTSAAQPAAQPAAPPAAPLNVFTRDDTFFGICQALGEDFGFNPLYLRIALGAPLIWYPEAVIGAYAALGLIVLASRLLVRNPRRAAATPAIERPAKAVAAPAGVNDPETLADTLAAAA